MYSIHNRDDLENLQEPRSLIRKQILKQKVGKQDFQHDMEEVFPVTENQEQNQIQTKLEAEKQIQALRDFTQTTQVIRYQTRAIYQSSSALNKNLQKSIKDGIQEYDEITNRNNQLFCKSC